MAERLALFFARPPKNTGALTISDNGRVVPARPPRRHIHFSAPAMITNSSFKKKATHSIYISHMHCKPFWEYLNDVTRVADKRLMSALMAPLSTLFWHPVVCTASSSPSADLAAAATAYTTEMIRSLTDQKLLHAFLVVLISEEGGIGKDLEPEV
ncbi:hypothetical protein O0I10_009757 [Lichtheimia ornata]|uniref:Uncharacterized protein n=1 Tax=Lichtheimia ornata TaxID=688661 RepID=A0AAD7XU59_9FUNG|nr:uncharacterized protein O0I10_009757 [Lichtheimia ornata]KAJ8654575.1 hypothetical protein O0I10_009757 [Lichtheimia ornata]